MFQHALLNELIAFISVAEHGSFTLAAESLSSTKSSTGKAVSKLETELGIKLFNRTTRSVRLTEEGVIYLEAAKQAIDAINEAKLVLNSRKAEPAGRLRVNLPLGIGKNVAHALPKFVKKYPKVTIELSLSDRFEDAILGEWDIVVRIGHLEDSSFVAKKLCQLKRVICASPEYLSRKGKPQSLQDFRDHDTLVFRAPGGKVRPWVIKEKSDLLIEVSPNPLAIFNDGRTLTDAVVSGLGVCQIYDKAVEGQIRKGELVELMPEKASPGPPVNALVPSGRSMPAKTKAFLDFLSEHFGNAPDKVRSS